MLDTRVRAWSLAWWILFLAERILPYQDLACLSVNTNLDRRDFQWSWAYAIRLGSEDSSVILVGAEGDVVAASFSEFVRLYIEDAEALYPKRSEQA